MFAFVIGTGRCGSTLVQEVLARHPDCGFLSNLEDRFGLPALAGRWNGPLYRRLPASATEKGRVRFAPSEGYRILDRQVSRILAEPPRDLTADDVTPWLAEQVRGFFTARRREQRAPVFLHKFTGWPRAGLLRAIFPTARFVHVVRDGRAVANSWLQMPWWRGYLGPARWQWGPLPPAYADEWDRSGHSFPLLAGLGWKLLIDAHEEARQAVPREQWLEVRYEDVVREPEETFSHMLEFLGLDFTAGFGQALARQRFTTRRCNAFAEDLDMQNFALLQMSLRDHLGRFGYAPSESDDRGIRTIHLEGPLSERLMVQRSSPTSDEGSPA